MISLRSSRLGSFVLVVCFCFTSLSSVFSQESRRIEQGERIQFTVAVETVTLDVVVVDKRGRFVPGLLQNDFEILDGGVSQEIGFFTAEFTPVTTTLLLDSSSSIRSNLGAIQTAAYLFTRNLSEGDRVRIGLFANDVRFGPRFSNNVGEHYAQLRTMRPAGKTVLYDAVIQALDQLSEIEGRKSLLIFTDGDDAGPVYEGSQSTREDTLEAAKYSQVTIYTVGFTGWGPDGSDSLNRTFLTALAETTGGRAFFPDDIDRVQAAFADVQEDLHRHYRLAYIPNKNQNSQELWRPLEVRIKERDDLMVRTRQGYYVSVKDSM